MLFELIIHMLIADFSVSSLRLRAVKKGLVGVLRGGRAIQSTNPVTHTVGCTSPLGGNFLEAMLGKQEPVGVKHVGLRKVGS